MLPPTPLQAIRSIMRTVLVTALATVSLVCCWAPHWASGQAVDKQSVEGWITQLGADDYLTRLKSEEAILGLGSPAIEQIKLAVDSPDIEISIRARRLLVRLLEQDFVQRKAAFLDAPLDSPESFGFPQWDAFVEIVGRSPQTKQLFIDIVQNKRDQKSAHRPVDDAGFLGYLSSEQQQYTALPTSAVEVAEELFNRLTELAKQTEIHRASTSTADQPVVIQQLSLSAFEANLPKTLVKTVNESIYRDEIRALVTAWIQARQDERGLTRNQIETIFQFELTQLKDDLNEELNNERSKVRFRAAEAIAKVGGRDAIKMLTPFLTSNQVVAAYPQPELGKSLEITLGDLAFQLILALEGRSSKDFGLLPTAGSLLLSESPIYGFVDRQSANQGIAKWKSDPKR
jgi:HEAT repeat protein